MIFVLIDGRRLRQPPEDLRTLDRVELTAGEWIDQEDLIKQLRTPWIRNANKDRNIRPARSSNGYKLLRAAAVDVKNGRSTRPGYSLTIETPFLIESFTSKAALQMIRADADILAAEFGGPLTELQLIMDFDRSPYYRIKAATFAADPGRPQEPPQTAQKAQDGPEGLSVADRIKWAQERARG